MLARSASEVLSNHIGGARSVLPHPHVERPAKAKRKSALGLVELHRGHTDIHHDAVNRRDDTLRRRRLRPDWKSDPRPGSADRRRTLNEVKTRRMISRAVAVDADDLGARDIENHPAVAAGAKGRVDIDAAIARRQLQIHGLDGPVPGYDAQKSWNRRTRVMPRPRRGIGVLPRKNATPSGALRLKYLRLGADFSDSKRAQRGVRTPGSARPGLPPLMSRMGYDGLPWHSNWEYERQNGALAVPKPVRHFTSLVTAVSVKKALTVPFQRIRGVFSRIIRL